VRKAVEEHLRGLRLLEEQNLIVEVEIGVVVAVVAVVVLLMTLVGDPMGNVRPQETIVFAAKSGKN
jgi:hypothetical protein